MLARLIRGPSYEYGEADLGDAWVCERVDGARVWFLRPMAGEIGKGVDMVVSVLPQTAVSVS
jgi:hypothetical protein